VTAQEAALAWAQGKKVEADYSDGIRMQVSPPGGKPNATTCNPAVFCHHGYAFRLAPEPKLRPLTIEEWKGHLGAGVVYKANGDLSTVLGVSPGREIVSVYVDKCFSREEMLERFTFLDGSPCGVMEGGPV